MARRRKPEDMIEPPVRFYKYVALTFLLLTVCLLGLVLFMSSKRAIITITTEQSPIDVSADLAISQNPDQYEMDGHVQLLPVQGAVEVTLSGSREEPGIATGVVTLINDGPTPVSFVRTTRLLTPEGVLFRLESPTNVPALGQTDGVVVYADEEGKTGDIGPSRFTIPGLTASRQKVVYAKSTAPMTGGVRLVGAVSEKDVDAGRAQLTEALLLQGAADSHAGPADQGARVRGLVSQGDNGDELIGQETDVVTLEGSATVVVVTYDVAEVADWARMQLLKRSISDSDVVQVNAAPPKVRFVEYNADSGKAVVNVFQDGTVKLNPQSNQLRKSVFFGMSREDVKRYLLPIKHVHAVDVTFRPAWMRSVPHIEDHVSVIVREEE